MGHWPVPWIRPHLNAASGNKKGRSSILTLGVTSDHGGAFGKTPALICDSWGQSVKGTWLKKLGVKMGVVRFFCSLPVEKSSWRDQGTV